MNNKKMNAALLWKQYEDVLVPALRLSLADRAVYSHLLRHTLLEGKERIRFSIGWLARGAHVSSGPVRQVLRRLAQRGAIRLVERARTGHVIEVRRRTRPLVVFCNVESLDRLIYAIFSRFNADWKTRTLNLLTQAAWRHRLKIEVGAVEELAVSY